MHYSFLLPDVLRVQVVNDEPFEKVKDNAVSLRQEVEKKRDDPAIYSDFMICVRAQASPSPAPSPKTGF